METITEINVKDISPNPKQPRKEFDKEKLMELAESIRSNGLINPIQVKQIRNTNKYLLICGERRWKAHKLLKQNKIKAIVKIYKDESSEMVESLIENLHRSNLSYVERENYITQLWKTGKYSTYKELGKALGLSESGIGGLLQAKVDRDITNASPKISTRMLLDTRKVDVEDKKKLFKKIEQKKISPSQARDYSRVLKQSSVDVKTALFKEKISLEQANKISKISNENIRKKLINAHKEIKNIDKGLEKSIGIKKLRNKHNVVKIKETINSFRETTLESQKINQTAIKNLMKCMQLIDLMDDEQINKLKYYQDLFEMSLTGLLNLIDKLKKKVELIN